MKKLLISFILPIYGFCQSVNILPNGIVQKSNNISESLELNNVGSPSQLRVGVSEGSVLTPIAPSLNYVIANLESSGLPDLSRRGAFINIVAKEKWSFSSRGTGFNFGVIKNQGNSILTKLTIDQNKFVGIGTALPLAPLHIIETPSGFNNLPASTVILESNADESVIIKSTSSDSNIEQTLEFIKYGLDKDGLYFPYAFNCTLRNRLFNLNNRIKLDGITGTVALSTLDPATTFASAGDFALRKTTFLAAFSPFANFNRNGSSVINVIGNQDITGITDGVDGLVLYITVIPGVTLRLFNENTNSLEKNRVITHTGGTFAITAAGGGATLIYDGSSQRWRVIGVAQ